METEARTMEPQPLCTSLLGFLNSHNSDILWAGTAWEALNQGLRQQERGMPRMPCDINIQNANNEAWGNLRCPAGGTFQTSEKRAPPMAGARGGAGTSSRFGLLLLTTLSSGISLPPSPYL